MKNVPQESPVGDHRSNGLAENAVREVKRQVRVLRSSLEEMIGKVLREDDPVLAWLPPACGRPDAPVPQRTGRPHA